MDAESQLLAEKDAEIHQLERDLADAVQNIQAHSMIVDANEKDAEIERWKETALAWREQTEKRDKLITELADWVRDHSYEGYSLPNIQLRELLQRAREATR
jgi:hypothetical protein